MKRFLAAILIISLVASFVSGITLTTYASDDYSVAIGDSNRIAVDGAKNGVSFVAQYDEDGKLVHVEFSHLSSYMPKIDENTTKMKAFLWDSMEEMNNLATPAEKEINLAQERTIKFSDIKSVEIGAARTIVKYWTDKYNNKTKSISIKNDATYTINGEANAEYNNQWLADQVASGYISGYISDAQIDLFCLTASDVYDYDSVEITVYEDFIVDGYDELANKIYSYMDSPSAIAAIDLDSADYVTRIKDVYGNSVSASQLKKYNMLSMCVTPYDWRTMSDIRNIDAILVENVVSGMVTEVNTVDNEVCIDGKAYAMSPMSLCMLMLGDSGNFYFNLNGEIVFFDAVGSKSNYAVIVNAAPTTGVDKLYQVKMYTSEGKLEVRFLADKVKMPVFKGSYTTTSSYDDDDAFANLPSFPAVCSYTLNKAGEISSLSFSNTTYKPTTESVKSSALVANNLNETMGKIEVEGKEIKRVVAGKTYYMNESTKIIVMDSAVSPTSATREDFCVYSCDEFKADVSNINSVSVYNTDTSNYAGLVFIYDEALVKEYVDGEPVLENGYGIILNAANRGGVEQLYQVKMYTGEGKLVVYDLAPKVTMSFHDGATTIEERYDDDSIYNKFSTLPVVCKYSLNEFKQIIKISFGRDVGREYVESDALITNEAKEAGSITGGASPVITTDKAYNLTKDTKIIVMDPTVDSKLASLDDLCVYSYDEFDTVKTNAASVSVYDADVNSNAGLVIIYDEALVKEYTPDGTIIKSGYGVIINKGTLSGPSTIYQVKMYTPENGIVVRDLSYRVKMPEYNGSMTTAKYYDDEEVYNKITAVPIVCSYKINSAGEIASISFASAEYTNTLEAVESSALVANSLSVSNGKIQAEDTAIKSIKAGKTYYMNDDTVVIAMNSNVRATAASDEDFAAYTADDFKVDQSFDAVSVYNTDSENYAAFVFIYTSDIDLETGDYTTVMVRSVNEVNNAVGDATIKIRGYNNAGATTHVLDPEQYYDLTTGEVFIPKTYNSLGEVKKLIKVTENHNGRFQITSEFVNAYMAMLADDSDSTFYFGKVDYKQKNTIYFQNVLSEKSMGTAVQESIIVPNSAAVMVYDASRASSNRVTYETAGYMSYATKLVDPDDDPATDNSFYPISNEDIGSYYILVRVYRGQITDVVYYCYTSDVTVGLPMPY